MAEKKIKTRIQQKHDVEANWIKANNSTTPFVPLLGELIIYDAETSTTDLTGTGRTTPITYERFKIGDGKTTVASLPFAVNPHDHNDLYYTESEINTKLNAINAEIAAKAPGVHDHEISTTTAEVVKEINPGSFSKTTKYLHKTTANAAPHTHTHSVTVSGTTGANSGTAVKAVTGYGSFSGGSLTGTKTFNTDAIKSIGGTRNYGFSASTSNIMTTPTVTDGILSFTFVSAATQDAHTGTAASTGTVGFTAASLGTATTADVAPSGHTHTFSDDATTGANSGSAVAAITGLTANTTQATGDITYVEAASHTAPSVKTTETVVKTVDIV